MCDRLRKAVADMREYEKTGGDDNWYQWSEKFDALYAALDEEPPRREWQSLTEEEWTKLHKDWLDDETTDGYDLMNAVEAALKERNA